MNKPEIRNYLKEAKKEAMEQNATDKPFIRQYLNDTADQICRDLHYMNMKEDISDRRLETLQNFAHEYAADLQPK